LQAQNGPDVEEGSMAKSQTIDAVGLQQERATPMTAQTPPGWYDDPDEPGGETTATGDALAKVEANLDVQRRCIDGIVVLAVRGELDLLTSPQLTEAITASLADEPVALIVDLSELDFLASAGMSVLIQANDAAGKARRFAVIADGPSTSRPMKLLGLDSVLSLYSTLDAALAGTE
jgi:anti-anti-sigma factor